jgi:UDPglucose 6-dehydrogenase
MKIAVIGTGYVGLTVGAVFAKFGHDVICVDSDKSKIDTLLKGGIPIYEPGLADIIKLVRDEKKIEFTTDLSSALKKSEVYFIGVGTPQGDDGAFNLDFVKQAARDIGKELNNLSGYKVIVMKSTVPPGTNQLIREIISSEVKSKNVSFDVVSNPEFLKEGAAIKDFESPDRIVIGTDSERAKQVMEQLYHPFQLKREKLIFMRPINAEITKLVANSCLATKISFINEAANICDAFGGDIMEVREGVCSDRRIGWEFYFPSVGYGGSCFPKDVRGLIHVSRERSYSPKIIQSVDEVNNAQKLYLANKMDKFYAKHGGLKGKTIAVWGLSFKPRTDDVRESAATHTIRYLLEKGAKVNAYDPKAVENMKKIFGTKVTFCDDKDSCLRGAYGLAVLTEWDVFRAPDFAEIKSMLKLPVIFDGRNIYDPKMLKSMGFSYYGVGRGEL